MNMIKMMQRGRDFRRPEVRYDPEVILVLAGGEIQSKGVNADYGEDYIHQFLPSDMTMDNQLEGHFHFN